MAQLKLNQECRLCPKACGIERRTGQGFCGTDDGIDVASVTLHHGEEPCISGNNGICNIFFSGCNLQCLYCQNYQISRSAGRLTGTIRSLAELIKRIVCILEQGVESIGFVSPSHMVPQVKIILEALHGKGFFPIVVYNTNAYERIETLRSLEGLVDVYLPDLKYLDPELSARWSHCPDYPEVATKAVKEMYRQKGNRLIFAENGKIQSGMIVRHLVLPGYSSDSVAVFRFLAEELSNRLAISLMAQYHPTPDVLCHPPLNRRVTPWEYRRVVAAIDDFGFETGWLQESNSPDYYLPDFSLTSPFNDQETAPEPPPPRHF